MSRVATSSAAAHAVATASIDSSVMPLLSREMKSLVDTSEQKAFAPGTDTAVSIWTSQNDSFVVADTITCTNQHTLLQ